MVKRLNWIDSSKGILIILVVIGHIAYWGQKYGHTSAYDFVATFNFALLPYYMPAFFIITGFVANFNMPFFKFFKKNFLSLIVPNIFLGTILNYWLKLFLNAGLNYSNFLNFDYVGLFVYGGSWFLSALFISKLIYWLYEKYFRRNCFLDLLFFSFIFLSGVILYNYKIINIWSYQHGLILTPFLYIGRKMRENEHFVLKYKKFYLYAGGALFIVMFLMQYYEFKYPYINSIPYIPLKSCIVIFPISIIGTTIIFLISQMIHNCNWLINTGKHSLNIYLLHSSIAIFLLKHSLHIIDNSSALMLRGFVAIIIIFLTILICVLLDIFIDKHFPVLKGKYHIA